MKATPKPSRIPPLKLHRLARRLEAWRATPTRGRRIPEQLWQAAAELARVHGLSATASALKHNYYDLQRRLGPNLAAEPENPAPPQFVQLPACAPGWSGTDPGTVELLQ